MKYIIFTAAAAMLLCLMDSISSVDTDGLVLDIARYRELSETLTMDAEDLHERLDRNLIEQECQTYIENKAEELGLQELTVRVAAEWSAEGFWLPESVCIEGQWSMQEKERLYKEALRKHDAIIRALKEEAEANKERLDYLNSLNILLTRAINDLKKDLGIA